MCALLASFICIAMFDDGSVAISDKMDRAINDWKLSVISDQNGPDVRLTLFFMRDACSTVIGPGRSSLTTLRWPKRFAASDAKEAEIACLHCVVYAKRYQQLKHRRFWKKRERIVAKHGSHSLARIESKFRCVPFHYFWPEQTIKTAQGLHRSSYKDTNNLQSSVDGDTSLLMPSAAGLTPQPSPLRVSGDRLLVRVCHAVPQLRQQLLAPECLGVERIRSITNRKRLVEFDQQRVARHALEREAVHRVRIAEQEEVGHERCADEARFVGGAHVEDGDVLDRAVSAVGRVGADAVVHPHESGDAAAMGGHVEQPSHWLSEQAPNDGRMRSEVSLGMLGAFGCETLDLVSGVSDDKIPLLIGDAVEWILSAHGIENLSILTASRRPAGLLGVTAQQIAHHEAQIGVSRGLNRNVPRPNIGMEFETVLCKVL